MSPRPTILDELGRELVRAASAAEAEGARRGPPWRRGRAAEACGPRGHGLWRGASAQRGVAGRRAPRAIVVGLLALLGLAAVAAAATLIVGRGDPIPAAKAGDVPRELRPVEGSERLNGLAVPDPDGGPAWDVRTSRSRTGAICATVGQVLDGELGLLGLDRRFRALPAGAADTCSTPQRRGATLAGARGFRGGGKLSALTVVNGVAALGVRKAIARAGGRSVELRLGPGRAFLAVFRGLPEEVRPSVVLTESTGRRTTLRFADSGEFIAADPSGGTPWALRYPKGSRGLRCVSARRERGPDSPTPAPTGTFNVVPASIPPRCAPAGRAFVQTRRFVPRAQSVGHAFWWGLNPARTVVWGVAPAGAGTLVLHGAGAPHEVRVDRPRGGFLAVLDGRVDPRALRVSAGGRSLRGVAVGTKGQRLARTAVPAWRSVATAARGSRMRFGFEVKRGTVKLALRAEDPTGGPTWALRTWDARISDAPPGAPVRIAPGGSQERDFVCFAFGIERGSQLLEPRAGGATRVVGTDVPDARCNTVRRLETNPPGAEVRTYVDDPDTPDPRPVRVVAAGQLGDGVRSAQLLGAGAPRPLELGRHGTFLFVLGPEHAGKALRVRLVRAGGASRIAGVSDLAIDCVPRAGTSMRIADPGGGQSWVAGQGTVVSGFPRDAREHGGPCDYVGRLAGGRLAFVLDGDIWMRYGAVGFSAGPRARQLRRGRPLTIRLQGVDNGFGRQAPPAPPSAARVARRTLPGRTVLSGTASSAVTSITLRTPRDVRTVRPAPGGAFIAVYDGKFYGGEIRATAHLRSGRSVTQTVPVAPF